MITASEPVGAGPASPSTVTMAPSGQVCTTSPTWRDVEAEDGPVPYRTASPGSGLAVGGSTCPWAAAQSQMVPVKGYEGMGMPACCHTQVANSAHHASQGP